MGIRVGIIKNKERYKKRKRKRAIKGVYKVKSNKG